MVTILITILAVVEALALLVCIYVIHKAKELNNDITRRIGLQGEALDEALKVITSLNDKGILEERQNEKRN